MRFVSYIPLALSFVSVAFSIPTRRSVSDVLAAIDTISAQTNKLSTAINAFPLTGGNLLGALSIHNNAVTLVSNLGSGTSTVTATGPVDEDAGNQFLTRVTSFEPVIFSSLDAIVARKDAFKALPVGGIPALVLQDLKDLKSGTVTFANALITNAPGSLVPAATKIRDDIAAAFDKAIAAYS